MQSLIADRELDNTSPLRRSRKHATASALPATDMATKEV
jgi:hypothetical protein